jgi:hypothetical protein
MSFQARNTSTGTGDTLLVAAPGQYRQFSITSIVISNSSLTDSEVDIKSGTTIIATFPAPNKGGCVAINLDDPLITNENEDLNFAATIAATTIKVTILGHVISINNIPNLKQVRG